MSQAQGTAPTVQFAPVNTAMTPGGALRCAGIDATNMGMRDGAAHDSHMQRGGQLDVIGIARVPGDQARIFAAADA